MAIKSKLKVPTAIKIHILYDADLLGVECLFACLLAVGVTGGVAVGAEPRKGSCQTMTLNDHYRAYYIQYRLKLTYLKSNESDHGS